MVFFSDVAPVTGGNATSPANANADSEATLNITQKLLNGAGVDVNLVSLRQAEVTTKLTQYELRAAAEQLVATIEEDYWNLAFAERQVVIVQNSLDVAQALLDQTNELIKVQRTAESERAAAEAEVAQRREDLIDAKSTLEKARLDLLTQLAPVSQPFWKRTITVKTLPFVPVGKMDSVERHVEVGLRLREDVNEARLQMQSDDLQIVVTKNGLLPELDFFVQLGKTSYSNNFGNIIPNFDGSSSDAMVGVKGNYAFGNHVAKAAYRNAVLTRQQQEQTMDNLYQTVQTDVRKQYIEAERTRQQIDATKATRIAQEEAVRVETEKYHVGRSTTLLVSEAQRDLLTDQLAETQAITNHLNALVELYRLEGSLLFRRGIEAPGGQPVTTIVWH